MIVCVARCALRAAGLLILLVPVVLPAAALAQRTAVASLADMSLEELAQITVTSVSRRPERLSGAPASVFVITGEDIRRSGYRTLPEALRLAPNLQVARIDSSQYAISARGFNNAVGNKLLVLIDGRTVYTPVYSGVFWDQQDVMLEDVERIEVISGPGATLWGANAVNGVINVISRPAGDTQGPLLAAGAGDRDQLASFRHGIALGQAGHARVYGRAARMENTAGASGAANDDGRDWWQAGFRADLRDGASSFTLQGDAYEGRAEDRGTIGPFVLGRIEVSGANLLGRLTRELADGSQLRVQAYVDQIKRRDPILLQPDAQVFDVEFQHSIPAGRHQVVWGGGYRYSRDTIAQGILAGFRPDSRELNWANLFIQDEIHLTPRLALTPGLKVEHNDYTGAEYLPSARLAWRLADRHLVWASAARAVRAPARYDREVFSPLFPSLGGPNFESEVAEVLEAGYRGTAGHRLTWSATLFRHEWERLRSGTTLPLTIENRIDGPTYGMEAWATWQASRAWRVTGGFTTLQDELRLEPGSTDPFGPANVTLRNDPDYQWMLRSSWDVGPSHELDATLRRVGELPVIPVPAYTALDLRYAWRPQRGLELSMALQNLANGPHPEFRTSALPATEIERSVFFAVRWAPSAR